SRLQVPGGKPEGVLRHHYWPQGQASCKHSDHRLIPDSEEENTATAGFFRFWPAILSGRKKSLACGAPESYPMQRWYEGVRHPSFWCRLAPDVLTTRSPRRTGATRSRPKHLTCASS